MITARLLLGRALLATTTRNGLADAATGARIGTRALAAHRQHTAVAQAAIRADLLQPLDVAQHGTTKITLNCVVAGDIFAQRLDLRFSQVLHAHIRVETHVGEDFLAAGLADAIDVLQSDFDPLVTRQIDTFNTRHNLFPTLAAACASDSSK